jgi:ABC-2 type transport system ATP-binding protein
MQCRIHKPELLILDEPTSGLDPLIQSAVFDLFRKENKRGCTIFFSSHVLSDVQKICSRVAIIQTGKIIKVESIENLRKKMLKKISISFSGTKNIKELNLRGVVKFNQNEENINFMFNGDMNELIKYLSDYYIDNIIIEEPTLEEIFIHYYWKTESNDEL